MIPEQRVSALLRDAGDGIDVPATPVTAIIGRARRGRAVRRTAWAAVAVVGAGSGLLAAQLAGAPQAVTPGASAAGCVSPVPVRPLPAWARSGFTGANPSAPYVLGEDGDIAGVVFGERLHLDATSGPQNKILWIARSGAAAPLRIEATLDNSEGTVRRELPGGTGPSILDLPAAGCWRVALHWGNQSDTVWLRYEE
jgi:hypothetical protein